MCVFQVNLETQAVVPSNTNVVDMEIENQDEAAQDGRQVSKSHLLQQIKRRVANYYSFLCTGTTLLKVNFGTQTSFTVFEKKVK